MKNQVKLLVFSLTALLALAGVMLFVLWMPKQQETDSSEPSIPLPIEEIRSVVVHNPNGMVRAAKQGDAFVVAGLDGFALSDNVKILMEQARGLEAVREIPSGDDLAKFGLTEPEITVGFETEQGVRTLRLGNEAPSDTGRYALFDDKVYLISQDYLTAFSYGPEHYISLQVSDPLSPEETADTIQLTHGEETLSLAYVPKVPAAPSGGEEAADQSDSESPAFYRLASPPAEIDQYDVSAWANGAFGLTAQAVEAIHPTAAKLAECGLDVPETTLTVASSSGNTVKLLASAPLEGVCYLMREGVPLIYRVSQADVPWRTVVMETLTKSVFGPFDKDQIESLEVRSQDKEYRFMRGSAGTDEAFDAVVDAAMGIPPEYLGTVAHPAMEAVAVVTVAYTDPEREPDTLRLIPTGSGSLYLELNGVARFTAGESYAAALLQACEAAP